MKYTKLLVIGSILSLSCAAAALQDGKYIKPTPPDLLAKANKQSEAMEAGRGFAAQSRYEEAIKCFREAIKIEGTMGDRISTGSYGLAQALTSLGRLDDALLAYKQAIWWDPIRKDLDTNGVNVVLFSMDYAILLAKCGKVAESKAIYYYGVRRFNWPGSIYMEPVPFTIVFESDSKMTTWQFSVQKLEAAATMAKAPYMQYEKSLTLARVRKLEPTWYLPVVLQASLLGSTARLPFLAEAERLATSEAEKAQIRAFRMGEMKGDEGLLLRKVSPVLIQAKLEMAKYHGKVACEKEQAFKKPGHGLGG